MTESIICNDRRCYICARQSDLECHHIIHGNANRKIADKDGLWVYLCHRCHTLLHDKGMHDKRIQAIGQRRWMETFYPDDEEKALEEWHKRYGKSFLEVE